MSPKTLNSVYLKLDQCSSRALMSLKKVLKLLFVVIVWIHLFTYTKRNIQHKLFLQQRHSIAKLALVLIVIKPIDLPKMVIIRKRSKSTAYKKSLGNSIEERPEMVNNRFEFGHWEIDLVLGKKNKGDAVVLILVEHQTRLPWRVSYLINKLIRLMNLSNNYCFSTRLLL